MSETDIKEEFCEVKKLLAKALEDNKVTVEEFRAMADAARKDADVTECEIKTLKIALEKLMVDATRDEQLRAIEELKATVPASVFKETVRDIQMKNNETMKWVILGFLTTAALFFLQGLLPYLQAAAGLTP